MRCLTCNQTANRKEADLGSPVACIPHDDIVQRDLRRNDMTTYLPELTAEGLVLWRVRRSPHEQLWCSVHDFVGELSLTVQDPAAPRAAAAESHPDIGSLITRADHLQEQLLAAGWELVDIDLDEPD